MKTLKINDIKKLTNEQMGPCVSIYVPMEGAIKTKENLSKLIEETERLLETSYSSNIIKPFLHPVINFQLPAHIRGTLCLFRSLKVSGYFILGGVNPPLTVVADSFHIKPVLEENQFVNNHYVLSLTSCKAELYQHIGNDFSLVWFYNNDEIPFGASPLTVRPSGRSGVYLNTGIDDRGNTTGFMNEISIKVRNTVPSNIPIVLLSDKIVCTMYRIVDRHPSLQKRRLSSSGFYGSRLSIMEHSEEYSRGLKKNFIELALSRLNKNTENNRVGINESIKALAEGEAVAVYLSRDNNVWGRIDWKLKKANIWSKQIDAFDDDVLDNIAEKAVKEGVPIYLVDKAQLPRDAHAAVILKTKPSLPSLSSCTNYFQRIFG